MLLIDVNLLLSAVNQFDQRHQRARQWWEDSLVGPERIGLTWATLIAFLRISTHPKIFPVPLTIEESLRQVEAWYLHENTELVLESPQHLQLVSRLIEHVGTAGNLATDAHLAAIALGHDCTLCSADTDFARFPGLQWINPLAIENPAT